MNDSDIEKIFTKMSAVDAAQRLLGCELIRTVGASVIRVKIVETEAYDQTDAASHSYKGRTLRTDVMFGRSGRLYVYFTYGMHYCCNIVVGEIGYGAAVLIRAVEPLEGEDLMQTNRPVHGVNISNGPAKLCQALQIDKSLNGHNLSDVPLTLKLSDPLSKSMVIDTTRVGISKAKERKWRFYIRGNTYVTKTKQVS